MKKLIISTTAGSSWTVGMNSTVEKLLTCVIFLFFLHLTGNYVLILGFLIFPFPFYVYFLGVWKLKCQKHYEIAR